MTATPAARNIAGEMRRHISGPGLEDVGDRVRGEVMRLLSDEKRPVQPAHEEEPSVAVPYFTSP